MARLTQDQWRELIAEQAQSGLSATAFCAARDINPKYFSLRKSRLPPPAPPKGFIRAQIPPSVGHLVEVTSGAVTLRIPSTVPAQWLADIVKALC